MYMYIYVYVCMYLFIYVYVWSLHQFLINFSSAASIDISRFYTLHCQQFVQYYPNFAQHNGSLLDLFHQLHIFRMIHLTKEPIQALLSSSCFYTKCLYDSNRDHKTDHRILVLW